MRLRRSLLYQLSYLAECPPQTFGRRRARLDDAGENVSESGVQTPAATTTAATGRDDQDGRRRISIQSRPPAFADERLAVLAASVFWPCRTMPGRVGGSA